MLTLTHKVERVVPARLIAGLLVHLTQEHHPFPIDFQQRRRLLVIGEPAMFIVIMALAVKEVRVDCSFYRVELLIRTDYWFRAISDLFL